MHKIEKLEELYSLLGNYISDKDITKPLVIFYNNSYEFIRDWLNGKSTYAIANFPHDAHGNYVYSEPSDRAIYDYTVYSDIEFDSYLQYSIDIADKMHKPVLVIAHTQFENLFPKQILDDSYEFIISFEAWMKWATQINEYGNQNITLVITDFLNHVGEEDWAQHRPESWKVCSDTFCNTVADLLDKAPEGYNYIDCVEKSSKEYKLNGIHPEVLKQAIDEIPEEVWKNWLNENISGKTVMSDGRLIDITYDPNMSADKKLHLLYSIILNEMLLQTGEKDSEPWTRKWLPRKVDLDMIDYFKIPVKQSRS